MPVAKMHRMYGIQKSLVVTPLSRAGSPKRVGWGKERTPTKIDSEPGCWGSCVTPTYSIASCAPPFGPYIRTFKVLLHFSIPHILCSTLRAEHSLVQSAPAL